MDRSRKYSFVIILLMCRLFIRVRLKTHSFPYIQERYGLSLLVLIEMYRG